MVWGWWGQEAFLGERVSSPSFPQRASRGRCLSFAGLVYPLLYERRGFFKSVFFAEVIYTQYNLSI